MPVDISKVEGQIKLAGKVTFVIGIILTVLTAIGLVALIFVSSSETNTAKYIADSVGTKGIMYGYVGIAFRFILVIALIYLGKRIKEGGMDKRKMLTWTMTVSIVLFLWFVIQSSMVSPWPYVVLVVAFTCDNARRAIGKFEKASQPQ